MLDWVESLNRLLSVGNTKTWELWKTWLFDMIETEILDVREEHPQREN